MAKKEKQDKIDLMVKGLNIDIPIIFDPYKNATDCMRLWDKFTLGKWASVNSYAVSNEWVAKVVSRKSQPYFEISAEGFTMIEAMAECMYRYFKNEVQYSTIKFSDNSTNEPDKSVPLLEPQYLTEGYDPKVAKAKYLRSGKDLIFLVLSHSNTPMGLDEIHKEVLSLHELIDIKPPTIRWHLCELVKSGDIKRYKRGFYTIH